MWYITVLWTSNPRLACRIFFEDRENSVMQKHGPWTICHSRQVYQDAWLQVRLDDVLRPDGAPGTYTTINLKSGVCVVAVDVQRQLHLTKEFHYAVGRDTIEGVSGGIEPDESPLQAAERELAEELGLVAKRWIHLGQIDPFTAAVYSTVDLYLAQDLDRCEVSPEGTEQIEHVILPLDAALDMLRRSQISHAPTCVAMLRIVVDQLV